MRWNQIGPIKSFTLNSRHQGQAVRDNRVALVSRVPSLHFESPASGADDGFGTGDHRERDLLTGLLGGFWLCFGGVAAESAPFLEDRRRGGRQRRLVNDFCSDGDI